MLFLQCCCGRIHFCVRLLDVIDLVMLPLLVPGDLPVSVSHQVVPVLRFISVGTDHDPVPENPLVQSPVVVLVVVVVTLAADVLVLTTASETVVVLVVVVLTLAGLVLAEVELSSSDQVVALPPWLGQEITGLRSWSNRALAETLASRRE